MAKKITVLTDKYKSTTKIYPKVILDSLTPEVKEYIESQASNDPKLFIIRTEPTYIAGNAYSISKSDITGDYKQYDYVLYVDWTSGQVIKSLYYINMIDVNTVLLTLIGDVSGGKQLYQHNIYFKDGSSSIHAIITNDNNTKFTIETFTKWLYDNGFTGVSPNYLCYPLSFYYSNGAQKLSSQGFSSENGTTNLKYRTIVGGWGGLTIADLTFVDDTIIPL